MRGAPRHAEFSRWGEWFHAAAVNSGGERSWISAAVSLSKFSPNDYIGIVRSLCSTRTHQRQYMAQLFHEESLQGVLERVDHSTLGDRTSLRSPNDGSRVMAAAPATCQEQLRENQRSALGFSIMLAVTNSSTVTRSV